ncbi:MAG: DUF2461 domain-containing protein [Spirochaetales bacterium]|nr:DUF2461 domain-containing protein [Spirochaetales bacterium]
MSDSGSFAGFGPNAQRFFFELGENNNKTWFQENRGRYEDEILRPAERFVSSLGRELAALVPDVAFDTRRNGAGSVMRIHRDVRFSPDKSPYKLNLGVVFWVGEGRKVELPGFYFHMDAMRSFFYGGQHGIPKEALERYRTAVDAEKSGTRLEEILDDLARRGLPIMEEPHYKRIPRGYPADHPRARLLRYAGIGVGTEISHDLLTSPDLIAVCLDHARRMVPLVEWFAEMNVGKFEVQ